MRFIVLLSSLVALASLTPTANGSDPDALLRDIKGKWEGMVVRDEKDPNRPVVEIIFHCDSDVPDAVIEKLAAFPNLRKLGLIGGQKLTDKGLEHIGKLRALEYLSLRNEVVTADGLKHLARLPNLKTLHLWGLPLTKENATALAGCPALERLELRSVTVSPEAVTPLKGLPRLKEIGVFACDGAFRSADEVRAAFPGVTVR
jgi:hypothetical protein